MKNKKLLIITACALAITALAAVKPAMAYFTDYSVASGEIPVIIKDSPTDADEEFDNWTKHITISNKEDGYECFVRVVAMAADKYTVTKVSGDDWTLKEDGYYYYNKILPAGGETTALDLQISGAENDDFNIIIVHEGTKVLYDADGNPYADWNAIIGEEDDK